MRSKKRDLAHLFHNLPSQLIQPSKPFYYGTAGFRGPAKELSNVVARASLVAYLRSATFCGKRIGIMITASHNPASDNGLKFIDHTGDMFDEVWEAICDEIVNCADKNLLSLLGRVHRKHGNLRELGDGTPAYVVLGRDTRESGKDLCDIIRSTLCLFNCTVEDYGEVSTPQMHFLIRKSNQQNRLTPKEAYIDHLAECYTTLSNLNKFTPELTYIDTANGIAKEQILQLEEKLKLPFTILNTPGELNYQCGADYIKSKKAIPVNIVINEPEKITKAVSFDGDVDRLIYFFCIPEIVVIDGDRICVLLTKYISELIEKAGISVSLGVVLSCYSNHSAISYLKKISGVAISVVNVGVKNFVRKARTFDIGIYFEPNGHGSINFSAKAVREIERACGKEESDSAKILRGFMQIFDPCIGDAMANFLACECVLPFISLENVAELYRDYPSRMLAVRLENKNVLRVNQKNEVIEPPELQANINSLVVKYKGRCLVRPSGTEDLVRVYAESTKAEDCDMLCVKVAQYVYDLCGGVGRHPEISYVE